MSVSRSRLIVAAMFGGALSASANAEIRDYLLEWSGESFGNQATATGHISIDHNVLMNPGLNQYPDNDWVTAFDITVTGSIDGDGTWALADFYEVFLNTEPGGGERGILPTGLDFTRELVGQPTGEDPWGTPSDGAGGDFNFFSEVSGAPNGYYFFTILVGDDRDEGPGDPMRGDEPRPVDGEMLLLTSFRPVPTPGPLTLSAIGLGLIARRRRRL